MSSKQDRTYTRTAAQLENKYNFGKSFSEILGIANDAQTHAYKAEELAKEVEARVLNIDVLEELNVSAGTIEIKSQGLSIQSENFSLSADNGIKTTRGNIGLWDISDKGISKATNNYYVKFTAPENTTDDVLTVAKMSGGVVTDTPFYLKADGTVKMNKGIIGEDVDIYGALRAATLSTYTSNINGDVSQILYDENSGTFYFEVMKNDLLTFRSGMSITRKDNSLIKMYSMVNDNESSHVQCKSGKLSFYAYDSATFVGNKLYLSMGSTKAIGYWTFSGDRVWIECPFLVSSQAQFDASKKIYFSNGSILHNSIECAEYALRLDITGDWYCSGTWSFSSGESITSDRNRKNNINDLPDTYGTLFDNLRPVVYKYNDGTSDRYHTGFIAQEVDEAINAAGLTRKDFAGLCIQDEGKDSEIWSLRYSEFIALNTYEIQKLKKELAEIKAKIGA